MNNLRKPVSPVLSAVILAATIIAVGVIVLMWISGHSSMVIRQSQVDLIRSEQAAKENLVIVHVSNSSTDIIIYVINIGYSKVFLGPIRIPELRQGNVYSDIFTPEGVWFNRYDVYEVKDSVETLILPEVNMKIGSLPEYLENLNITDPNALPTEELKAFTLSPYNEVGGYYKIRIPNTGIEKGKTYSIELWTVIPIYDKLYLCKLYTAQLTT